MIYCFGDSLTEGKPGVTYVKYLTDKHKCLNCGLGGDTLIGLAKRIDRRWYCKLNSNDYVVIGIGANDLLIPFLSTCSPSWNKVAKKLVKRGSVPCENLNEYKERYTQLLEHIKEKTKNIIVFGLPIFEYVDNDLDSTSAQYNKEIERICEMKNISYIDFRKWQKDQKEKNNNNGSYFFATKHRTNWDVIWDTVITTFLPFEKRVSEKRGLFVTVDGCHLNKFSAKGLAEFINEYID